VVSRGEVPAGGGLHPGEECRLRDVHLGRDLLLQLVRDILIQQADGRGVPTIYTRPIGERDREMSTNENKEGLAKSRLHEPLPTATY
jgi:hypothetical protein